MGCRLPQLPFDKYSPATVYIRSQSLPAVFDFAILTVFGGLSVGDSSPYPGALQNILFGKCQR